jgi:hypothetical protein
LGLERFLVALHKGLLLFRGGGAHGNADKGESGEHDEEGFGIHPLVHVLVKRAVTLSFENVWVAVPGLLKFQSSKSKEGSKFKEHPALGWQVWFIES